MRGTRRASLWDVGEGVLCLEFHTKMNALDAAIVAAARRDDRDGAARRSCCTTTASSSASAPTWRRAAVRATRPRGTSWTAPSAPARTPSPRSATRRSPWSARPPAWRSAAAARSCCTATRVQAHAESYIGLPEVGVGIVPGWGGCLRLLQRLAERAPHGPQAPVQAAFETIGLARVSGSAAEARALGFLGADDRITMNRDRLLADAKAPSRSSWPTATRRPSRRSCACPARPAAPRSSSASPATRSRAARCRTTGSCSERSRTCWPAATPTPPCRSPSRRLRPGARRGPSLLHTEPTLHARREHAHTGKPLRTDRSTTSASLAARRRSGETETYDDVLGGAAELCRDVIAPLNAPGDLQGAVWKTAP